METDHESFSEGTPIRMELEEFSAFFRNQQRLLTQQRFRQKDGGLILEKFVKKITKQEKKREYLKAQQTFQENISDPHYISRFMAKRNRTGYNKIHRH